MLRLQRPPRGDNQGPCRTAIHQDIPGGGDLPSLRDKNESVKGPSMPAEKSQNVQDVFLNHIRKNKAPVTIFLVNGVKLQGIVTWFDNFSLLLRRDGHTQLVYKHAISTIMPSSPVQLFEPSRDEAEAGA
ncbi:Protein hfq [Pararhodospirillum photometricum DSM 122]|uniref:RNA-binding protein Hfq n=2 Tax=Pararhodospirillum photometricum TaxID=1084 RepID=H6SSG1_PARPM|nr:Protein hfq [Pararhodospirillum photometricum DSM 122]